MDTEALPRLGFTHAEAAFSPCPTFPVSGMGIEDFIRNVIHSRVDVHGMPQHGATPALNRITDAFTTMFTDDSKLSGSRPPYIFDPVLFRQVALGTKAADARPVQRRRTRAPGKRGLQPARPAARNEGWGMALRARENFSDGRLNGVRVEPYNQGPEYARWARGSGARLMSGPADAGHAVGVITGGGSSPLPALGRLDTAPAMAMALGEARYIVRSHGTVIAWWLGPEVYDVGEEGEWVETRQCVTDEAAGVTPDIAADQNRVHIALTGGGS